MNFEGDDVMEVTRKRKEKDVADECYICTSYCLPSVSRRATSRLLVINYEIQT